MCWYPVCVSGVHFILPQVGFFLCKWCIINLHHSLNMFIFAIVSGAYFKAFGHFFFTFNTMTQKNTVICFGAVGFLTNLFRSYFVEI